MNNYHKKIVLAAFLTMFAASQAYALVAVKPKPGGWTGPYIEDPNKPPPVVVIQPEIIEIPKNVWEEMVCPGKIQQCQVDRKKCLDDLEKIAPYLDPFEYFKREKQCNKDFDVCLKGCESYYYPEG